MKTTKINKSAIFKKAWELFKNQDVRTDEKFAECLKSAWQSFRSMPSLSDLYKRYYNDIYRFVSFRLNGIDESGEIVNDTFIKAGEKLHLFDASKSNIKTWLTNIAKNNLIDFLRKEQNKKSVNVSDFADAETGKEVFQYVADTETDSKVVNNEMSESINKAMNNLKPNYRKVAELFFIEDKSHNEICELTGMPLGTVKATINRVRTMLQTELRSIYSAL